MADVQDLFVERIEGERYLFEDEWLPLEVVREEIPVKGRAAPDVLDVRITHHGPIVNEALGADDAEPLALRWQTLDAPDRLPGDLRAAIGIAPGPSSSPARAVTSRLPRT